ncbi:hypothetical protein ACI6Q5_21715 [Xanthomonas codiaei]|uniref:Lipoprotein n=2 Tax=Xanthomonas codiaei TaxID=56463 RepID=A0ABW9MTF8_9XANT|nr:hypothetical protein [Xanthomonas codiaei]
MKAFRLSRVRGVSGSTKAISKGDEAMRMLRWAMILGLAGAALISGCSNKDTMRWKEQVWLSDGQRIDVDRYSVALKSGFPNTNDGPPIYQEITYSPLGVHWSAKTADVVPEMLSFDVVNNDAYLVVAITDKKEKFCVGKPSGTYLIEVYRWRKGVMQRVDQQQAPIAQMGVNLSGTGNWGVRHADRPVTYLSWDDIAYVTRQPTSGPPKLISEFYKKRDYAICD